MKKVLFYGGWLMGVTVWGVLTPAAWGASISDFIMFDYDLGDTGNTASPTSPGRLLIPPDYNPNQTYPLFVFYPGSGEDYEGGARDAQINNYLNNLIANAKSRHFFLYATQFAASQAAIENSMRMVARALKEYSIDPSRIYVTGLSLGGTSSYQAANDFNDIIAGSIPMAGGSGAFSAANVVGRPMWIFHARDDGSIPVSNSRNRVNAIRAAQGKPPFGPWPAAGDPDLILTFADSPELRYTEYATGGHSNTTWSKVYGDTTMYEWFLGVPGKSRVITPPQAGETLCFDFGAVRLGSADVAATDSQSRYWNGTTYTMEKTTGSAAIPFAMTTARRRTSVIVDVIGKFGSWIDNRGVTAGAPYDALVARDAWMTVVNATAASNPGVMEFRGLQPSAPYQIKIWASDTDNDGNRGRVTQYEINGTTQNLVVNSVATGGNVSAFALFNSVTADANGKLSLKVYAAPGTGSRYGQINALELTPLAVNPLVAWRQVHGLAADGSGDFQTTAGDGVTHLMKYALNLAPLAGDLAKPAYPMAVNGTAGLPRCDATGANTLTFTFVRRVAAGNPGILYNAQQSTDLVTWTSCSETPTVTAIDGTWERVTYTQSTSGDVRRYLRLQITRP
jgi:dienelactone hydrolase